MSTISAVEAGFYVYGIIDARDGLNVATPGIEGGDVATIEVDGIAAVVTQVGRQKIRPQRANLAVHHKLLHALVRHQPVIPCASAWSPPAKSNCGKSFAPTAMSFYDSWLGSAGSWK